MHMCPESGQAPQECCLRVSLMPLRLNIDQVGDSVKDKAHTPSSDTFKLKLHCYLFSSVGCAVLPKRLLHQSCDRS